MRFNQMLVVAGASFLSAPSAWCADAVVDKVVVKAVAHFDFNRDSISERDRDSLLAEVGRQQGVTWQTVTATGHTDSVGSRSYNQRLSQKRASAVKSFLVGKGLSATMIRTQAKAAQDPVAPNTDEQGRALNRRTDVQFEGIRGLAK